jgi:tRNA(fMet)-specific endonuclease VapC
MKLLDTDTLSLLLAQHARVAHRFDREHDDIAIAIITRIEVLLGRFDFVLKAADGDQLQRAQRSLAQSEQALANYEIVPIDTAVAAMFDGLRENKKLRKIGRRDLLIACIAIAHHATLVSRNTKHFQQVPGLKIENWAD